MTTPSAPQPSPKMAATPILSTPCPPPQIFTPENPTAQAANAFSDPTTIARADSTSSIDTIMGMDDNPRGINDVPLSRAPARTEDPEAQTQAQTRAKNPARTRTRNGTAIRDLQLLIYVVLSILIQALLAVFVLHRLVIITIVLQIEVTLVILVLGDEKRGAVRRGWERAKGYVGMGTS